MMLFLTALLKVWDRVVLAHVAEEAVGSVLG